MLNLLWSRLENSVAVVAVDSAAVDSDPCAQLVGHYHCVGLLLVGTLGDVDLL